MSPDLKTPPHRRLIRTDTPGIYRRGDRYVAITYDRGKGIKTTHDTEADACKACARRSLLPTGIGPNCKLGRSTQRAYGCSVDALTATI